MNLYLFDYRLKRVRRTEDLSKRNQALDRLAEDLGKLRKRHRPSRWDAVFETISPLSEVKEQAQLLRSLTRQLKSLDPDDVGARLDRIETWATSFSGENYIRWVFGNLARDGTASLSGQNAVDRFDRYRRQLERELDDTPELLGHAIYHLAPAISNLDRSTQIASYDALYQLMVDHLSRYTDPDADYNLIGAFGTAIDGLRGALKSLTNQYIAASHPDDNSQPILERLNHLRGQVDRLPHASMRGVRRKLLAKIEVEILERWLAETPIARFRVKDWSPRETLRRIGRRRR
jgi:hypothetical protein